MWPLAYLIKKPSVPTKTATVSLITVKYCSALLRMQLICIGSYLQSVLRYQFLILDTSQPDNPYLHEQDVRIRGYSSKPKGLGEQKCLGNPVLGRNTQHAGTVHMKNVWTTRTASVRCKWGLHFLPKHSYLLATQCHSAEGSIYTTGCW